MMMKINQIWEELEGDKSFSVGLLYRRYSGAVLPDVFIALKVPENFRCIAASLSTSVVININTFANLKDICVELIPDENNSQKNILLFKLINNQHVDIFSVLCEDLIESISTITSESQLIKELLNRFEKWKSLFDKAAAQGLLPEEQRGLYGELYFLRKFILFNINYRQILDAWLGPDKQIKDFQSGTWGVEIKTTQGNNHQKVQINSERQLDTSNLKNLFLFHLSLEARHNSGETLNQIVDAVGELLKHDFAALNRFQNKLLLAGYFIPHRHLYDNGGYFVREEKFYRVEDDFPRIEEKDIRYGVGDVKYSIIVSQCSAFICPEAQVFQTLTFI